MGDAAGSRIQIAKDIGASLTGARNIAIGSSDEADAARWIHRSTEMISRCAVGGVELGGMEVRACESGENTEYGKGNRRRFYDGFYPFFYRSLWIRAR